MEDLNKQQMVLLTLLVSFVTSIATGIITVALLAEAPPEVPQTVNRIIERTIERVVPDETKNDEPTRIETITKEVTVTLKEDDLFTSSVEKNIGKIARVYSDTVATGTKHMAIATLLSKDGVMIAERGELLAEGAFLPKYTVVFADGVSASAEILGRETYKETNPESIAFLKLSETKGLPAPVGWTGTLDAKLGQTVAVIGGGGGDEALKASISRLNRETLGEGTSSVQFISSGETNPALSNLYRGSAVFNLDGSIVGFIIRRAEEGNVILPIRRVLDILGAIQKTMTPEKPSASVTEPLDQTSTPSS
jgi:hypothetical protein